MSLLVSPSGIRGVVGTELTPEVVSRFGTALGRRVGAGSVVAVARDTRTSGPMLRLAAQAGLMSAGCDVVDIGVCPTPTAQLFVRESECAAGVVISGSHNPAQWNALKLVRGDGLFLYPEEMEEVSGLYRDNALSGVGWRRLGSAATDDSALGRHLDRIIEEFPPSSVRARHFRVVVDACNGAGAVLTPTLLREMGCRVIELNCTPDGVFAHPPEPVSAHLLGLGQAVRDHEADLGCAHDADADRLVLADEKGQVLSEEYTLLIAAEAILSATPGPVVTNMSTTSALEEIADRFDSTVHRTPVGDIHVSRRMRECGAVVGGEGNGGVIIPRIQYCRDGIAAVALVLSYLARRGNSLSSIVKDFPERSMTKEKINSRLSPAELETCLARAWPDGELDDTDGIKVTTSSGWVHVRASRTEPVLRLIIEAGNAGAVENLRRRVREALDGAFERSVQSSCR